MRKASAMNLRNGKSARVLTSEITAKGRPWYPQEVRNVFEEDSELRRLGNSDMKATRHSLDHRNLLSKALILSSMSYPGLISHQYFASMHSGFGTVPRPLALVGPILEAYPSRALGI
jgi:hypothetical protein